MDFLRGLIILFPIIFCFLLVLYKICFHNSIIPITWPVIGAIPTLIANFHRLHKHITDVLAITGGAFLLKGPILAHMDMLFTANPSDIHYIMSKNFPNYFRSQKFREIFDILGDAISNSDGDLWEFQRSRLLPLLNNPSFHSLSAMIIWNKVEKRLLPLLDNICEQGVEADSQDIFQRFTFDVICEILFDYDPKCMSLDLPYNPCEKVLSGVEEALLFRHIMPEKLWKLQRSLGIGSEKKLSDACKIIDEFIYENLAKKENDFSNMNNEIPENNFNFQSSLRKELKGQSVTSKDPDKFLRDILVNLLVAGRDGTSTTLSWFVYILAKNPIAEEKIREELKARLDKQMGDIRALDFGQLVYLHGARCETLRLFPSVPFQHKTPIQPDVLPCGYKVDCNTSIILCFYTMGRMESIWGNDCLEFKPERWLTKGGIKHQPSYKFPAFNVGPRTCLGKKMSFTQMKIVAATIIYRYHVELVEGHLIIPCNSLILHMKNGLKVRLTKRSEV